MLLRGISRQPDDVGVEAWIRETETRIRNETIEVVGSKGQEISVTVSLGGPKRLLREYDAHVASRTNGHMRKLQSSSQVRFYFMTAIKFNSKYLDWNPDEMVAGGFRTIDQQDSYIFSLKAADASSFGGVESMAMEVEGTVITDPNPTKPEQSSNMPFIIGGTVGGMILLLVGGVVYKRRSRSSPLSPSMDLPPQDAPQNPSAFPSDVNTAPSPQNYFGAIEPNGEGDDISTLGDPYVEGNTDVVDDNTFTESMVSSQQQMYEFGVGRERFNTATSLVQSTTTGECNVCNPNLFRDDSTYENNAYGIPDGYTLTPGAQNLTVIAPAGKLGIVVDNQTGDMPVVHAIKDTSVLKGEVNVGDFLVSVDEIDCRGMSAIQVSKLISTRSHLEVRVLVLQRGGTE